MLLSPQFLVLNLLILINSSSTFFERTTKATNHKFNPENILTNLKNGDIIFRSGRSPESYAVMISAHKYSFSHVGIIHFENNQAFVIHAIPGESKKGPDYIRKEELAEFLSTEKASGFAVYRSAFTSEINEKAAENAFQFYSSHFVFDREFDLNSNDKLYCTELIIKAFKKADLTFATIKPTEFNFIFGKKQIVLPGNIIENPQFYRISNFK